MYKSLCILATVAISTNAYRFGQVHDAINNNFAVASMELDAVATKQGVRVAEFSHSDKHHGKVQGGLGSFNLVEQRYQCAQGFAFGL